MHQVIENRFEQFLDGTLDHPGRAEFEAHLAACPACREVVASMREMSGLFQSLRSPDAPAPDPGFYARLNRHIEQRQSSSIWSVLLEPAFTRRLAFTSLLVLAMLGSVLMSNETDYASGPTPEMILAVDRETPEFPRERMLMTLVSYLQE
ncbi:MAG: anti-sigma factor family protein [Bryobacteraceae bacterium]